jgi:uncharacterized protein
MALGVLWRHGLRFDRSANVLKPKKSEATAALEQIRFHFGVRQEPMWVLVPGNDEAEVIERFASVNKVLSGAVSNRLIAAFTLPTELWAQPENQQANRAVAATLLQQRETLQSAAFSAGFTSKALLFTEGVLDSWENAVKSTKTYWPTNSASRWVLDKVVTHSSDGLVGLGWVERTADASGAKQLSVEWPDELMRQGIVMSGWELLGSTVFDLVVGEMPILVLPIVTLVLISLWLAFRSLKEVVLSVGTLSFAGLCLVAAMDLLKWDWNILNLMAFPLLLGMGVDFCIHIQLALRRHNGDLLLVRQSVGRALLLAGTTTLTGFASLGFSTNTGMASLGRVCALGIALVLLIAVFLLPVWWSAFRPKPSDQRP